MGILNKIFGNKKNDYTNVTIEIQNIETFHKDIREFLFNHFMTYIMNGDISILGNLYFYMDNDKFYIVDDDSELPIECKTCLRLKNNPAFDSLKLLVSNINDIEKIAEIILPLVDDTIIRTKLYSTTIGDNK